MTSVVSLVSACLLALASLPALAAPKPTELQPLDHIPAQLVVARADGSEVIYSQADLEKFPTVRLETTTPWRESPAVFEGVLLRDILTANDLHEVDAITVTAENDFAATLPRRLWETVDVVVATRVDGRAHSRRERGPIQFVIDRDVYETSDVATEEHLVWMAARIETAE